MVSIQKVYKLFALKVNTPTTENVGVCLKVNTELPKRDSKLTVLAFLRDAENQVITELMPKFRSILKFKGHSLPPGLMQDFESLAMARLASSVHLHLQKWQSGEMEKAMSSIAVMSLKRVFQKQYSRDGLIESMKRML